MADIFISYAREDRDMIERLAAALETEGYSVWWDRQMVGGADFAEEIERELNAAGVVIAAWSAGSIKSAWVKDEAITARDVGKLIPISLDGVESPLGFKQFHLVEMKGWHGGINDQPFQVLLRTVRARLTGEAAHAAPAPPPTMTKASASFLKSPAGIVAAAVAVVAVLGGGYFLTRTPQSSATPAAASETVKDGASVAVLPFVDLSEAGDQEFFADGVSEEILNVLVRIPNLKVAGRTSSFSFKGRNQDLREIGDALDVSHILEGSVRRSGARLRITAQLIRSDDGFHLWSETYDRELTDIFDIQDEIARAVADELAVSLGLSSKTLVTDRTNDIAAYEKYLRAKQLIEKRGLDNINRAQVLFLETLARDPDYAPAWSGLSNVYSLMESYVRDTPAEEDYRQWRATGRAAAQRAIALNPEDAEAYVHLGWFQLMDFEWEEAFENFDRAVELGPDTPSVLDSVSQGMTEAGYFDEAVRLSDRAIAIDPLVGIYRNSKGNALFIDPTFAEAEVNYIKAKELSPNLLFPRGNLNIIYFITGQFDKLRANLAEGVEQGIFPEVIAGFFEEMIAAAQESDDALRALIGEFTWFTDYAIAHRLKDADLLIAAGRNFWDAEYRMQPQLMQFSARELYSDPRWKEQARKDGLLDLWKTRGFPSQCRPLEGDDFECYPDDES